MLTINGRFLNEDELRTIGVRDVGQNVAVHETCVLVGLETLRLGSNVRIDPFCVVSTIGGWAEIGDFVHVGSHCVIAAGAGVRLEDFAGLSAGVRIFSRSDDYSGDFLTNPTVPPQFTAPPPAGPVHLGRHVIVGAGATLLPEVHIGEGAAIGAGALVNRSLAPWGVYAGAPARRIRERSRKLLDYEAQLKAAMAAGTATLPLAAV
jgi:serine acetyltransferase